MNEKYNIIIPTIEKDMFKIIENLDFIKKNLEFKKIIFIGDDNVKQKVETLNKKEITYLNENKIYKDLTLKNVKKILESRINDGKRAGWYLQQFIKMGYATICDDEYYLAWDSDTIPLRQVSMFSKSHKPIFDLKTEYHKPYFETIKRIFNDDFEKVNEYSFISEHMLFKTSFMQEMINDLETADKLFFEKILNAIEKEELSKSGFSEFETYGTWVSIKYPNNYEFRKWKSLRQGSTFYSFPLKEKDAIKLSKYYNAISFEKKVISKNKRPHNGILPLSLYLNIMIRIKDILKEVRRRFI